MVSSVKHRKLPLKYTYFQRTFLTIYYYSFTCQYGVSGQYFPLAVFSGCTIFWTDIFSQHVMRISRKLLLGALVSVAFVLGSCGTPPPSAADAQFPAGTKVLASYKSGPVWMDATVSYVTAAEEYDVTYSNGETATKLPITSIAAVPTADGWTTVTSGDVVVAKGADGTWKLGDVTGYNGNEVMLKFKDGVEGSAMQPNLVKPATAKAK